MYRCRKARVHVPSVSKYFTDLVICEYSRLQSSHYAGDYHEMLADAPMTSDDYHDALTSTSCPHVPPLGKHSADDCSEAVCTRDSDCDEAGAKCCYNGCVKTCQAASAVPHSAQAPPCKWWQQHDLMFIHVHV